MIILMKISCVKRSSFIISLVYNINNCLGVTDSISQSENCGITHFLKFAEKIRQHVGRPAKTLGPFLVAMIPLITGWYIRDNDIAFLNNSVGRPGRERMA